MARPRKGIEQTSNLVSGNKAYVFSTLTNDQRYIVWSKADNDLPTEERSIFIKGGTGIANDRLITPLGVMTEIDESDIEVLEANPVFQIHADNGFVVIERAKADPEKVAADMETKDKSAPLTDSDFPSDSTGATVHSVGLI
jgi:hypothetical protein